MSDWRPTKERLLKPRACPKCGQWMSRAFLEQRQETIRNKISRGLRGKSKVDIDLLKEKLESGHSLYELCDIFGASETTIRNRIKELKRTPNNGHY